MLNQTPAHPQDSSPARDLRADRHGHGVDFACGLDRAFFRAHPAASRYQRRAIAHELCIDAPDGPCLAVEGRIVEVVEHAPGFRSRRLVA